MLREIPDRCVIKAHKAIGNRREIWTLDKNNLKKMYIVKFCVEVFARYQGSICEMQLLIWMQHKFMT